ncbi:hypothetical protein D3C75_1046530 [compost metagenome]
MITVWQQQQAMSGGHSPFLLLFTDIQAALFDNEQVEFAHSIAVRMLVSRLIDGTVTFQKIRKWRCCQVNI